MATFAAFPVMLERDRKREGLRICRASWLLGVTVREYRELEAGRRYPSSQTWDRICKLYGWPQTFRRRRQSPAGSTGRAGQILAVWI